MAQILVHYQLSGESDALNRLIESVDPIANVHAALETDLARLAAGYDSSELLESENPPLSLVICAKDLEFSLRGCMYSRKHRRCTIFPLWNHSESSTLD